MSISINKILNRYMNVQPQAKTDNKVLPQGAAVRNFDQVKIHSNSQQIEEKKLAESLSKEVLSKVSESTPESKIAVLKDAVSKGAYQVDAGMVAARILLQKGE